MVNMKNLIVDSEIHLKEIEITDAALLYKTIDSNREYLKRWLPFVDYTNSIKDEENFIQSVLNSDPSIKDLLYLIFYKENFCGLISLKFNKLYKANKKTEIGYWLAEDFQKKGIITKCCKRLIEFAFTDLQLNRVHIKIATANTSSIKIAERLNLTFESIEREGELLAEGFNDLNVYSILKKEYRYS